MLCPPSGMSLPRGTQASGENHGLSLAILDCQTTQLALHECPCGFPEISYSPPFSSPSFTAPSCRDSRSLVVTQRRQFVLMRKMMASYRWRIPLAGQRSPASGQSCFPFCLFSLIVSHLSWLLGNWENPLNDYYSLTLRPYHQTPLWK